MHTVTGLAAVAWAFGIIVVIFMVRAVVKGRNRGDEE